ncbi:hypothetical protein GCM10010912_41230 [Paenibacillus albidus]|uniref:Copper amine oxidase n=1 Tax=Paenibacillus albidus TaxID=2041023 RepID=A0A917FP15_9BACL|nr:hypothetical protein [Paenibacillus albidus]GGF92001.1 hypothetical protein GCM10010912_41230 [Paenibacillus albidus]
MKAMKKMIILIFGLLILSEGTLLYAASGKSAVAVYLNHVLQKQSGITSEGKVYLSAEQLSEDLNVLMSVEKSGQTVRIYKPNVNTVLIDDKGGIFGKVKIDDRITFSALVQVDHLKVDISEIKILITNAENKTETMDIQQIKEQKENFWLKSADFTYSFNTKGAYTVQVYFKAMDSKQWFPVSEIQIFTI